MTRPLQRCRSATLLLGGALAFAGSASAEIRFTPRFSAALTWADNAQLAVDSTERRSDMAYELEPGFTFSQESARLRSAADYTLHHFDLTNGAESRTFHRLEAGLEYQLIPEWFTIEGLASMDQQLASPTGTGVYGDGLFGASNLTDVDSYSVTPHLNHLFAWGAIDVQASYGRQNYHDDAFADSTDHGAAAFIMFGDQERRAATRFGYTRSESEFDFGERFRFERALAELGVRVGRTLRLLGQGGRETDIEQDFNSGGLQRSFWLGGFEWRPDRRNELRFLVGNRSFGRTYEGGWTHTARFLEVGATYIEEPTTQSYQVALRPFEPGGTQLNIDRGGARRGDGEFARTTPDVYLSKRFALTAALTGRFTSIGLTASRERRQYLALNSEDVVRELAVNAERRLSPVWTVRAGYTRADDDLREGISYTDNRAEIAATRLFGRSLTLDFLLGHARRGSGDLGYDVTWVRLGINKTFGRTQ